MVLALKAKVWRPLDSPLSLDHSPRLIQSLLKLPMNQNHAFFFRCDFELGAATIAALQWVKSSRSPQLRSEFEASLNYVKPCLKKSDFWVKQVRSLRVSFCAMSRLVTTFALFLS